MEDEEDTWDTLPAWHPDSEEITFLRCQMSQAGLYKALIGTVLKIDGPWTAPFAELSFEVVQP